MEIVMRWKKIKKRFVFNNDAYTLLEMMISLIIIMVVLLLLVQFMMVFKNNYQNHYLVREKLLLSKQLNSDILETKDIFIKKNVMILKKYNREEIKYKFINNKLLRQINSKGGEVIIYKLQDIQFIKYTRFIKIILNFGKEKYEENIFKN